MKKELLNHVDNEQTLFSERLLCDFAKKEEGGIILDKNSINKNFLVVKDSNSPDFSKGDIIVMPNPHDRTTCSDGIVVLASQVAAKVEVKK